MRKQAAGIYDKVNMSLVLTASRTTELCWF